MGKKRTKNESNGVENATETSNRDDVFDRAILIGLIVALAVFAFHQIVAYDFWWQLKTGYWVREFGFPTVDPFSYGFPDREWIELRWLYAVVISFVFDTLGPDGLVVGKFLLLLVAGAGLWMIGKGKPAWIVNLGLLFVLLLSHQRFAVRPELVTYLFLSIEFLLIYRFHQTKDFRWLLPLPLLQIVWVNSHTMYILGPIVLVGFVVGEIISERIRSRKDESGPSVLSNAKPVGLVIAGTILACLINPYGLKGALFAFQLLTETMSDKALDGLIGELRSPFSAAGASLFFISYIVAIVVSAATYWINRRSLSLGWLGIWVAFLVLSFMAERNVAIFGLIAGVSIMVNLGKVSAATNLISTAKIAMGLIILAIIPAVASNYHYRSIDAAHRFGSGVSIRRFPIRAVGFVENEGLPRPVMTGLGDSSYLLYKFGPKSVYVDGRLEVYGPQNAASGIKMFSTGDRLNEVMDRNGVRTLIAGLESDMPLIERLLKDPTFAPVYFDDSHIVFLKIMPETSQMAARFRIDWTNARPNNGPVQNELIGSNFIGKILPSVGDNKADKSLAQLYVMAGNIPGAEPFLANAVKSFPGDETAAFRLGVIYKAQRKETEAAKMFARVSDAVSSSRENQVFAAYVYEDLGNMAAAAQAWSSVAKLGEQSVAVYERMAESAVRSESWPLAYEAYTQLVAARPDDIQVLNNHGTIANILGKRTEALRSLERSLQLAPQQVEIATQIGLSKRSIGDVNGARDAFNRALAIDPNYQPAIEALNGLK